MLARTIRLVLLTVVAELPTFCAQAAAPAPGVEPAARSLSALKEKLAGYDFLWPDAIPAVPEQIALIDEAKATPAGVVNPCRDAINGRLGHILGQMKSRTDAAGNTVPDVGDIPNARSIPNGQGAIDANLLEWAVWGYLSADSRFQGDARLPPVIAAWLDRLRERLQTAPTDEKERATWKPDALRAGWSVFSYSSPLVEMIARPAFVETVGPERVEYLRKVFLEYAATRIALEKWNATMAKARDIVNMPVHEFACYFHAWLLTGEPRYYLAAYSLVRRMHDIQQPNGTIPYLTTAAWPAGTRVGLAMYYLQVYNDALYDFWQRSEEEMAKGTLAKNTTAYLLRMEPGGRYEYHTIGSWWKPIWRNFAWPGGPAMAALAAGDGELLGVARHEFGKGVDNWKLTLGADAFRKAALARIEEQPRQDRYIVSDPDIGGMRGRFGGWAFNFNTTSYAHTLGGVMAGDDKHFSFLHAAMPTIQVAGLETDPNQNLFIVEKLPPTPTLLYESARERSWAVAMASYHPYAAKPTWDIWEQVPAPNAWKCEQLWFFLPEEAIAVLRSKAGMPTEAVAHEHRFRLGGGPLGGGGVGADYTVGGLTTTVLDTSFSHRVLELGRLCDLDKPPGKTVQLTLTDLERPPHQEVAAAKGAVLGGETQSPPGMRKYSPAAVQEGGPRLAHYSLVRFRPSAGSESKVTAQLDSGVITMTVETGSALYVIHANPSDEPVAAPSAPAVAAVLWRAQRGHVVSTPVDTAGGTTLAPGEARVFVRSVSHAK